MLASLRARLAGVFSGALPSPAVVKSSAVARDRLAIILAHQRTATQTADVLSGVDMKALQRDLLDCVKVQWSCFICPSHFLFSPLSRLKRHIREADRSSIQISVRQDGNMEIFEMSVPLQ
jgi:septum formation topological specificity factor MinE